MKVLVLGGTGAIGKPVIELLSKRGEKIFVTSRRDNVSKDENVKYIKGNAHELQFIEALLKDEYDVIIDFMVYSLAEFEERVKLFLSNAKQYIFFSSARVYAQSNSPITESSALLLNHIDDEDYLTTQEYALVKAKQEKILEESFERNWTIIRPYITYNDDRLQLGVLEKENWLYRALHGRSIVFSEDIAVHMTTLTYAYDVALRVVELVGNTKAYSEAFQITTNQSIRWNEILDIYIDTLEKISGKRIRVYMEANANQITRILGNKYQVQYDRKYDRVFDCEKVTRYTNCNMLYVTPEVGLQKCVENFCNREQRFLWISWKLEAYFDHITAEKTPLIEIRGWKNRVKYLFYRYIFFPFRS